MDKSYSNERRNLGISVAILFLLLFNIRPCRAQIYASSLDKIPAGWNGPVFTLSRNYPTAVPNDHYPWLAYDFKTQPKQYMQAVLAYFIEGNNEVNWVVQNNRIRTWYHAPSMAWQPANRPNGREFIHGLTRERNSAPKELWPTQTKTIQNWAVGFYNAPGAYTFGRVWADTLQPDVKKGIFPKAAMSGKLLFTAATEQDAPYLKNALEWDANINEDVSGTQRKPQKVHLLQLDIAVKDSRSTEACWVFGTFAYNNDAPGNTVWEKMVPVGLMWGNDPGNFTGSNIKESWINPDFFSLFKFPDGTTMHIGYKRRLNGPVDNKISSCMSCHSTAQSPQLTRLTPDVSKPADLALFFRNLKCNVPFSTDNNSVSLDYSLQLSIGIAASKINGQRHLEFAKSESESDKPADFVFTSIDDPNVAPDEPKEEGSKTHWWYWIIGGIILILIIRGFNTNKQTTK